VTRGRLTLGHVVAALAALALMLVMAMDWYTTKLGEERREAERNAEALQRLEPDLDEEASNLAEEEERNAWQEDGAIDRVLLIALLATVGGVVFATLAYAAGRRFEPPLTPIAVVAGLALLSEVLVAYRIVQEPEDDNITEVVAGPPLALLCLAAISFGAFWAMREEGRASRAREPGWRSDEEGEERPATADVGDAQAETS
jgi:hypothetical protein